jgi:hypothetical protein
MSLSSPLPNNDPERFEELPRPPISELEPIAQGVGETALQVVTPDEFELTPDIAQQIAGRASRYKLEGLLYFLSVYPGHVFEASSTESALTTLYDLIGDQLSMTRPNFGALVTRGVKKGQLKTEVDDGKPFPKITAVGLPEGWQVSEMTQDERLKYLATIKTELAGRDMPFEEGDTSVEEQIARVLHSNGLDGSYARRIMQDLADDDEITVTTLLKDRKHPISQVVYIGLSDREDDPISTIIELSARLRAYVNDCRALAPNTNNQEFRTQLMNYDLLAQVALQKDDLQDQTIKDFYEHVETVYAALKEVAGYKRLLKQGS